MSACKKEVCHKNCCFDTDDILQCLCELENEIEQIKKVCGHKFVSNMAKEKIAFCLVLRELGKLDRKIDKILRELECGWDSDTDSNYD